MSAIVEEPNRVSPFNQNGELSSLNLGTNGDTIEELTREVEALKKKLEEERAKFNDVACKSKEKKNFH